MMLFLSYITRKFATTGATASTKHDPKALPATPIFHHIPPLPHKFAVHWWNASTVTVGVLGLVLSSPPGPPGFCPNSGESYLAEFSATFSWPAIASSDSDLQDVSSRCASLSEISSDSWMSSTDRSEEVSKSPVTNDGELATFGAGIPLKRVSTITRAVGILKRHRLVTPVSTCEWLDVGPLERWRGENRKHVPHVLTRIAEKNEQNC